MTGTDRGMPAARVNINSSTMETTAPIATALSTRNRSGSDA